MTGIRDISPVQRPITRASIETAIAMAWNAAGTAQELLPLAWKLGNPWDGITFVADADAYAPELRRDIIESWIAALGLADDISPLDDPLTQQGTDMVWTGAVDTVTFQLSYPRDAWTDT